MRTFQSFLPLTFITAFGLFGCSSPVNPEPKAAASPPSLGSATTASNEEQNSGMPFPKLEKGMTAETVRKLLGEPKEIQPTPSPAGKTEVWVYHFEKNLGMVQVAAGTRPVQVMSVIPNASGTVTVQEPVYNMAAKKAEITLSLLMINGQLEVQKAKVEKTVEHGP